MEMLKTIWKSTQETWKVHAAFKDHGPIPLYLHPGAANPSRLPLDIPHLSESSASIFMPMSARQWADSPDTIRRRILARFRPVLRHGRDDREPLSVPWDDHTIRRIFGESGDPEGELHHEAARYID